MSVYINVYMFVCRCISGCMIQNNGCLFRRICIVVANTVCISVIYVSAVGIRAQAYVLALGSTTVPLCADDSREHFQGAAGGRGGQGVVVVAGGGHGAVEFQGSDSTVCNSAYPLLCPVFIQGRS